jgi:hypothetical protein
MVRHRALGLESGLLSLPSPGFLVGPFRTPRGRLPRVAQTDLDGASPRFRGSRPGLGNRRPGGEDPLRSFSRDRSGPFGGPGPESTSSSPSRPVRARGPPRGRFPSRFNLRRRRPVLAHSRAPGGAPASLPESLPVALSGGMVPRHSGPLRVRGAREPVARFGRADALEPLRCGDVPPMVRGRGVSYRAGGVRPRGRRGPRTVPGSKATIAFGRSN